MTPLPLVNWEAIGAIAGVVGILLTLYTIWGQRDLTQPRGAISRWLRRPTGRIIVVIVIYAVLMLCVGTLIYPINPHMGVFGFSLLALFSSLLLLRSFGVFKLPELLEDSKRRQVAMQDIQADHEQILQKLARLSNVVDSRAIGVVAHKWPEFIEVLQQKATALYRLLEDSLPLSVSGDTIIVSVKGATQIRVIHSVIKDRQALIDEATTAAFGRIYTLEFIPYPVDGTAEDGL